MGVETWFSKNGQTVLTVIGIGAGAAALGALLVKKIYNKKNKKD